MKPTYLIIVIFIFGSCNRTTKESKPLSHEITTIDVNENDIIDSGKLSDVISIDSLVFLEYTNESIIGEIDKVIVSEEYIYIIDMESSKCIFCFDRKGNFINSYKNVGRGPQEYIEIDDVSFFRNKLYVLAEPNQFFVLDKKLKFIESIEIKWNDEVPRVQDNTKYFSVINSDTILFYHPSALYHYHLYSLTKEAFFSSHIKRLGTLDRSYYANLTKNTSDNIYLSRKYNDTIYSVTNGQLIPEYYVYWEKPMTDKEIEERLKLTVYNSFNYPLPEKMYSITSFIKNKEFISFEFIFKRYRYYYFYNKKKSSVKIFKMNLENDIIHGFYLNSTIGHHQNSNITWVDAAVLVENKEEIAFSIPDDLTYDSNPALVFYRPKFD
ncbi:MAG TPA: 6-bladed beta-propeller [Marinilabiliaceae bacterium]|nr:6-bladed beta-propeller [Marinilabiliaceae bacterium]